MATTWVYWLGRLVKLAIVAPSTLMLGFLALVNLGMKPIAEPGRWANYAIRIERPQG